MDALRYENGRLSKEMHQLHMQLIANAEAAERTEEGLKEQLNQVEGGSRGNVRWTDTGPGERCGLKCGRPRDALIAHW